MQEIIIPVIANPLPLKPPLLLLILLKPIIPNNIPTMLNINTSIKCVLEKRSKNMATKLNTMDETADVSALLLK